MHTGPISSSSTMGENAFSNLEEKLLASTEKLGAWLNTLVAAAAHSHAQYIIAQSQKLF